MKTIVIMLFILLYPQVSSFAEEVYYPKLNVEIRFYAPSAGKQNGNSKNNVSFFKAKPISNRTLAISRDLYRKGIKPGTKIFIPNLGYFIVEDLMGPKAKGNQIDICVDSAKEAFRLGVLRKTIYLVIDEN